MRHKSFQTLVVGTAFPSVAAVFAAQAGDAIRIAAGFENWYLVNSMIVTKDTPQFAAIGGFFQGPAFD
jgi:hypothetical protein